MNLCMWISVLDIKFLISLLDNTDKFEFSTFTKLTTHEKEMFDAMYLMGGEL